MFETKKVEKNVLSHILRNHQISDSQKLFHVADNKSQNVFPLITKLVRGPLLPYFALFSSKKISHGPS